MESFKLGTSNQTADHSSSWVTRAQYMTLTTIQQANTLQQLLTMRQLSYGLTMWTISAVQSKVIQVQSDRCASTHLESICSQALMTRHSRCGVYLRLNEEVRTSLCLSSELPLSRILTGFEVHNSHQTRGLLFHQVMTPLLKCGTFWLRNHFYALLTMLIV